MKLSSKLIPSAEIASQFDKLYPTGCDAKKENLLALDAAGIDVIWFITYLADEAQKEFALYCVEIVPGIPSKAQECLTVTKSVAITEKEKADKEVLLMTKVKAIEDKTLWAVPINRAVYAACSNPISPALAYYQAKYAAYKDNILTYKDSAFGKLATLLAATPEPVIVPKDDKTPK